MTIRKVLFLVFYALLFNCTVTEKPEFVGIDRIEVLNSNSKSITLSADALFLNKNDVSGTLKTDDLKVYINNTEVASIISEEFNVPKREQFKIPLTVSVATDSIVAKKSLGSLIGSLISQRLSVQYKGTLKYKVFGYASTYMVDETQELKIKF